MTTIVQPGTRTPFAPAARVLAFPDGRPIRMPSAPGERTAIDAYRRAQAEAHLQAAERAEWARHCAAQACRRRNWMWVNAATWALCAAAFAGLALKIAAA